MRLRHNKKRNTALVYEALVRELTKSIVKNNPVRRNEVISILKEYFSPSCVLAKELELYKPLYSETDISRNGAEKLLIETRISHQRLDKKGIFNAQTKLINRVNKTLGGKVFSNYVPNYKSIATIYSIFNIDITPKDRIMLEEKILDGLSSKSEVAGEELFVDDLTYKTFINKFNQKYGSGLLEEQSKLLNYYISSMDESSIELKVFLNEEIGRIKGKLRENLKKESIKANLVLREKTERVLELAEGFSEKVVDDSVVENVLKMQQLIREVENAAAG